MTIFTKYMFDIKYFCQKFWVNINFTTDQFSIANFQVLNLCYNFWEISFHTPRSISQFGVKNQFSSILIFIQFFYAYFHSLITTVSKRWFCNMVPWVYNLNMLDKRKTKMQVSANFPLFYRMDGDQNFAFFHYGNCLTAPHLYC